MTSLYVKLCGLSAAALPLLDIDILDYLRSLEFRTFLAQQVLTPLLTAVSTATVQSIVEAAFGVM